ncbi:MAG: acetyl-CoA carboxylase, biotin carboxyl carrier protein [Clostridia bacterium]|nr:acetyl-CoA carboxylase, biotin carboxyl carrier protein [Clostridia bacterium]
MDIHDMKELMLQMRLQGIETLEFEQDGVRLRLVRPANTPEPAAAAGAAGAPESTLPGDAPDGMPEDVTVVCSPVVGIFFAAPSPDSPPFARPGDSVTAGQTLCIVEAMKLMNEVAAPCDGILSDVLCGNGNSVEYGQPLFRIRAAAGE